MKKFGMTVMLCACTLVMSLLLAYFVTAPSQKVASDGFGENKASAYFNRSMNVLISNVAGTENKYSLQYDMSAAPEEDQSNYKTIKEDGVTKQMYEDETITVVCWKETLTKKINGKNYTAEYAFADVQISDPSQFRRGWSGKNPKDPGKLPPTTIFNNCNGIVGLSSDFYSYRDYGFVYQYGKEIIAKQSREDDSNDVLVVDYNGDFHIYDSIELESIIKQQGSAFTDTIMHSFTFGPALVEDGKNTNSDKFLTQTLGQTNANGKPHCQARACIGQLGELHYLLCTVGSSGVDMSELADEMVSRGCLVAYNLDGGQSGTLLFKDGHFNTIAYNQGSKEKYGERAQDNIIYFGTAKQ